MMRSAKKLVAEAGKVVETLSAAEAAKLAHDPSVVFVDLREADEVHKTGRVRGAVHVPRGLLEFQADPTSPTHKRELGGGNRLVLYCGSGSRSALAAKSLKEMGLASVSHVAGGFGALQQAGVEVDDGRA